MRTRALALAALLAVAGLSACSGGGVTAPPPSPPGAGPAPAPAPAGSVDCDALATRIASALTSAVPGTAEVTFGSAACTDGSTHTLQGIEGSFDATLTTDEPLSESQVHDVVSAAAAVWAEPDVRAAAPTVPYLRVDSENLSLSFQDGFLPVPADAAALFADFAASSDLRYSYFTVAPGTTITGIPFGTVTLTGSVRVMGESLDAPGLQTALADAWEDVTEVAAITGVEALAGSRAEVFSVPLDPAQPVPSDFVAVLQTFNSVEGAEGVYNIGMRSDEGTVVLQVNTSGAMDLSELPADVESAVNETEAAITAWGLPVRVNVMPPVE